MNMGKLVMPNFITTINKRLRSTEKRNIEIPQISATFGTDMDEVMANWPREATITAWLARTRKDLLLRIQRSGLPLNNRRQEPGNWYQTNCALYTEQAIERSKDLFWQCPYAQEIWDTYKEPWRII